MKVLSHLSGGKESVFPYLQTGGESDFHDLQTGDESSLHINFNVKMPFLKRGHVIPAHTSIPISYTAHDNEKLGKSYAIYINIECCAFIRPGSYKELTT